MKPLTIEHLKSLEVGDWVWIVDENFKNGRYREILGCDDLGNFYLSAYCASRNIYSIADYGTKWIAYKNKEQAECKGEIVELPKGWLDTLKLLTCAASCYAVIDDMIAKGMQSNKALADLFMKIPRVQGSTLQ